MGALTKEVSNKAPSSRSATTSNDVSPATPSTPWQVLHQTLGNQGMQRLLRAGVIQAKLRVGQPNDSYEREADHVADQVMRMPASQPQLACACGGECPKCRTPQPDQEHVRLQTKRVQSSDLGHTTAPPIVNEVLRSPGQPLDPATRAFMEPRFGHDFGQVRVHTDANAAESARRVDAVAFTVGHHLVFDSRRFAPHTTEGRRLLAHELTHVVQQNRGAADGQLQRQPPVGTAPARRTTAYTFTGCTDAEMETISVNVRQSYLMVVNAREQMTSLILSIIQAESSRDYALSRDAISLRSVVGRLFGADTLEVLRDVRNNFTRIANRYRADREVVCHHDPDRNQVASAEVGGTRIWIGPEFFSRYTDNLDARPRIFIHEMAHNAGIEHDMTGIAITAGETETRPAQVAHHADSYAELAYRIYARDFFGRMNRELDI